MLIKALRASHALLQPTADGVPHLADAPTAAHHRRRIRLAFLAPELQAAILDGRQPAGLTLDRLIRTPLASSWAAQMAAFAACKPILRQPVISKKVPVMPPEVACYRL